MAEQAPTSLQYAWTGLVVGGLLGLLVSRNMLTLGCSLLLIMLGLQLLYIAVDPNVALLVLVLLNLATCSLALSIAYLCGLVRSRLRTHELPGPYQLRDMQPTPNISGAPGKL